tara:strand:- start:67 stop:636 length:570 start_codon:yes stop_codon:yes gene_type:complete
MEYFQRQQISFDIAKLQDATSTLLSQVSWNKHVVKGVSMTQIPGDESSTNGDKLRGVFWTKPDATGMEVQREKAIKESDYTQFVKEFKGTYFEEVYKKLSRYYIIGRFRLLLLEPRTSLSWHRDPEPRLHIPIFTNPGAHLCIHKGLKHLPADGGVWFTDTRKYHTVFNGGEENRIHLVATYLGDRSTL